MTIRHGINWDKAQALYAVERSTFIERMPRSRELSAQAAGHLLFGVPLHWMNDWSTPFSLYVDQARGARFRDVYGHEYVDFCLGDTGSMFLGGMVTALAFIMGRPELVFFFGIVYIWDAMTVVIQRVYFKLTHGKRIFRMTPIHHAFEMRGWKEVKINFFFSLIAIIGVVVEHRRILKRG